jgi:intracellular sulfur oxidation DsrE/DsrF family protein
MEGNMQIKAVFHIDEIEKWNLLIGNIKNLINGLTDKTFEIEIVANSVAVKEYLIKSSNFPNELKELSTKGIKICACNNALNGLHIKQIEIFNFITIVPAGIIELIEKQNNGFAYIKP